MPLTQISVLPDITSAVIDGTAAPVVNGATATIGGASPAKHACLRFDFSAVADTDSIVSAILSIKTSATANINVDIWASEFGAAIANADYNLAGNSSALESANGPRRVKIDQIIPSGTLTTITLTVYVPSLYINKVAAVNTAFSDFELRPGSGYVPGGGATAIVHFSGAVSDADKPVINYVALTDTEIAQGLTGTFRRLAVGAEAYLAFDIEEDPGEAVKGKILLDVDGIGLDSYIENLASRALSRNRIRPRKITPGRAGAGGDFSFELTPEKCWKLLKGMMVLDTTGPVGSQYTHTFTVGQSNEISTFTFIEKVGAFRFVYPGGMIGSITFNANLDAPVVASASVMCRDEYAYDENAAGLDDAFLLASDAGYDTTSNSVLSFSGVSVDFDSETDPRLVQNFTIAFDQSVAERRGLSNTRFVSGHYVGPITASINFTLEFENERQYRKFIGDNTQDFPVRAGNCIELQEVAFTLRGLCDNADFLATITVAGMSYTTVRKPVNSEGAIYLQCSGVAVMDGNDFVTIVIKNTEASYPASTDHITVLPAGVTYPS